MDYIDELRHAFKNINNIHDYKTFPDSTESLEKLEKTLTDNFCFGIHTTSIKINDDLTYTTNNNLRKICGVCFQKYNKFISDCECLKVEKKDTKLFITRIFDLCFGFYTDTSVEFDVFVNNNFIKHYVLEKGVFSPLYNEKNENISWVSLNTSQDYNCWEIRNVNTNSFDLILLGANLNYNLRNETINSKKCEIVL